MRIIQADELTTLEIARVGEQEATQVRFGTAWWYQTFGAGGSFALEVQRPTDAAPYLVPLTDLGDAVAWTVSATDAAILGRGSCQLRYLLGNTLAKARIWTLRILASLSEPGEEPPEPWESYIDAVHADAVAAEAAQAAAELAQGKAEDAQEAAEAAQTAAETAQGKAEDAQTAAETAQGKAEDAQEAAETAQGKAEDAQEAAEAAQTAAETAQGKAEDAQEAAETAQGKAENAQTAAETAQAAAEAWATGGSSGTPSATNNAQYYAEQAAQSAGAAAVSKDTAAAWATGGTTGTPGAENNAQYYAGQAAGSAAAAADSAAAAQASAELVAAPFDAAHDYAAGDLCLRESALYVFTVYHSGAWSADDVEETTVDAELKKARELALGAYPTEEASGAIAHTDAGAADLPLKKLLVNIAPAQDLHGYDHPWPAGGGVNKFAIGDAIGVYASTGATYGLTITCDGATETVTISGTPNWTSTTAKSFRAVSTKSGSYWGDAPVNHDYSGLSGKWFVVSKTSNVSAVDADAIINSDGTIGVTVTNTDLGDVNIVLKLVLYEGSTAPTAWTPYSNFCPISGWTECNLQRTRKNLLDESTRQESGNNIRVTTTLKGGQAYTFSASPTPQQITIRKPDNTEISHVYTAAITYTPTEDITVKFDVYYSPVPSGGLSSALCQLELGSTATDYAPYSGTLYAIDLDGTRYGGTLDVFTGVMKVDRAIDTITKDSAWYGFSTGTGNSSAVVQLTNYQNAKYVDGSSSRNGAIASTCREAQNYWVNARQNEVPGDGDMCFAYSSGGQVRFHRTDVESITDLTSFKAAFPDTQIVYYLATPITVQLTPTEVQTLLGQNNLWADCGNVDVVFRLDPTLVLQQLRSALQS